jgi:hypothetical protein
MSGAMLAPRPERVSAELIGERAGREDSSRWRTGRRKDLSANRFKSSGNGAASRRASRYGALAGRTSGSPAVLERNFEAEPDAAQKHCSITQFSPKEVVEFFRRYFGPTQATFSRLDQQGQSELASRLESLWTEHNTASDGRTRVEAEYLDVRAICVSG